MSIIKDGKDLDKSLKGWWLFRDKNAKNKFIVMIHYQNGRIEEIPYPCESIKFTNTKPLEGERIYDKLDNEIKYNRGIVISNRYLLVNFVQEGNLYLYNYKDISVQSAKDQSSTDTILDYVYNFIKNDHGAEKDINDILLSYYESLTLNKNSALSFLLAKENVKYKGLRQHIYPFGINASQKKAVENSFKSKISVIEGPPGTGKTQTILNIIANIVVEGKTVAVVSNNNSAVDNVYEKLEKKGYGSIVATLGSRSNQDVFFEKQESFKPFLQTQEDIGSLNTEFLEYLDLINKESQLYNRLRELKIESEKLKEFRKEFGIETVDNSNFKNTSDALVYLRNRDKLDFLRKLFVRLKFNIKKEHLQMSKESLIANIEGQYYSDEISLVQKNIDNLKKYQSSIKLDKELHELEKRSNLIFQDYLNKHINNFDFTYSTYRDNLKDFLKRYPVITSTSFSVAKSLNKGILLDYIIIDESSQQSLKTAFLALSCARNVIVVGDSNQLKHIENNVNIECPDPDFNIYENSLLDTIKKVYSNEIPITMLREHYRCDPLIIEFCNRMYYQGGLIPMRSESNAESMKMIVTTKGNHSRGRINQRELDSIKESMFLFSDDIGYINPFVDQKILAKKTLKDNFVSDTIHKFQGRECDEIIFSTVLDKRQIKDNKKYKFVDDPLLVNVAVSRAKNSFVLVTGQDVFDHSENVGALISYIKYYSNIIEESKTISAFDLLYDEYDDSLKKFSNKIRNKSQFKSENIVMALIEGLLKKEKYNRLKVHFQVPLKQIVNDINDFTEAEKQFILRDSSCDFVIYSRIDKSPLAVVEVDGYMFHKKKIQIDRDLLKDSILEKTGIKLLRLSTIGSSEEKKLVHLLEQINLIQK